MAKKQRWVNVREARLLDQAIQKNSFRYLTLDEHKVVDKAYLAMKDSELYKTVWDTVEKEAVRIVEEVCKPEWNRISEEMKPLWERANELSKEKAVILCNNYGVSINWFMLNRGPMFLGDIEEHYKSFKDNVDDLLFSIINYPHYLQLHLNKIVLKLHQMFQFLQVF